LTALVDKGLTVTKIGELLARRGVVVPYRTLHRFCVQCCGFGCGGTTVRVADGEPGHECQVDFGKLGLVHDAAAGRRRVTHALIFTAVYSRHMFVWLSFAQTLEAVIAGCEAAWGFFGGVFRVLIPDNMSPVVAGADAVNPRFTVGWLDYAQHCGFATDPARVRHARATCQRRHLLGERRTRHIAGHGPAALSCANIQRFDLQQRALSEQVSQLCSGEEPHGLSLAALTSRPSAVLKVQD
jgi:hypothetical protein